MNIEGYLKLIKEAGTDDEIKSVIQRIYVDGFTDGVGGELK